LAFDVVVQTAEADAVGHVTGGAVHQAHPQVGSVVGLEPLGAQEPRVVVVDQHFGCSAGGVVTPDEGTRSQHDRRSFEGGRGLVDAIVDPDFAETELPECQQGQRRQQHECHWDADPVVLEESLHARSEPG